MKNARYWFFNKFRNIYLKHLLTSKIIIFLVYGSIAMFPSTLNLVSVDPLPLDNYSVVILTIILVFGLGILIVLFRNWIERES